MAEEAPCTTVGPWRRGYLLALSLALIAVALFYGVSSIIFGAPRGELLTEGWPLLLFQVVIAGAPFGVLAHRGIRTKLPWIVAVVLTVCFWSALLYSGWLVMRDQTGANIGMGWLMLLSPFFISGAALIAADLARVRS